MDATPSPSATSSLALRFLGRRSVTLTLGVTSAALVLAAYLRWRQQSAAAAADSTAASRDEMTSKTEMTSTSTPIKGQKEKVEVAEEAFAKYRLRENLSDTPETSWVEEVELEKSLEEKEEELGAKKEVGSRSQSNYFPIYTYRLVTISEAIRHDSCSAPLHTLLCWEHFLQNLREKLKSSPRFPGRQRFS